MKQMAVRGWPGGILSALLIFTSFFALADSNPSNWLHVRKTCEELLDRPRVEADLLTKLNLVRRLADYTVAETPERDGYLVIPSGAAGAPSVDLPLEESDRLWKTQDWQTETARYQLLDSGFKWLARESSLMNHMVATGIQAHPGSVLRMRFSPAHLKLRENLYFLRWRMHDAVLKKYKEKKQYLSETDLAQLTWATGWSDNSDTFGLLKGDPKPVSEISWSELYDRLALTIQVTYYGRRDYFRPTPRGVLHAEGYQDYDDRDILPFQYRVREEEQRRVANEVYSRFDRGSTCELMRYALFENTLPREVHDRLLLQVLERLEGRGMRTILAGGDPLTARLYKRYGFEQLMVLPTTQNRQTEYLLYLEVGSEKYEKVKAELKKSGKGVVATQ